MGSFDLRIHNLETDALGTAEFDDEGSAAVWLSKRPLLVEVIGLTHPGISREVQDRMRAIMRPLDDEEQRALDRLNEKKAKETIEREQQAAFERAEAAEARAKEQLDADPARPMLLEYRTGNLMIADPADPRELSEAATEAALAFIAERNEWIEERGQVVGRALLTVYPGEVPAGEERILPGATFVPVTK